MERQARRTPRPLGTTYLAMGYQQNPTEENKEKIIQHLINNYTLNGFMWNGKSIDIYKLSFILKLNPEQIMKRIQDVAMNMNGFQTPEEISKTIANVLTLSTQFAIQDKGRITQQVNMLEKEQGGKYKPFITSEMNQALKLSLESNKSLMDLFSHLTKAQQGKDPSQGLLGILSPNKEKENENYLTTTNAIKLLEQQSNTNNTLPPHPSGNQNNKPNQEANTNNWHYDKETLKELYNNHGIGDTPACLYGPTGALPDLPNSHGTQGVTEPKKGTSIPGQRAVKPNPKHHETRRNEELSTYPNDEVEG